MLKTETDTSMHIHFTKKADGGDERGGPVPLVWRHMRRPHDRRDPAPLPRRHVRDHMVEAIPCPGLVAVRADCAVEVIQPLCLAARFVAYVLALEAIQPLSEPGVCWRAIQLLKELKDLERKQLLRLDAGCVAHVREAIQPLTELANYRGRDTDAQGAQEREANQPQTR